MPISVRKLNVFTAFKLPAAFFTGVRATYIDDYKCEVAVRHRWVNQNPFKSMFWAVQGMAAELATGALMMTKIKQSGQKISMLVVQNKAAFYKKATGKIHFTCHDGERIQNALQQAITTKAGQTIWLHANGVNSEGETVSSFEFLWSIKVKY